MKKFLLLAIFCGTLLCTAAQPSTENIIIITLDGLRWQELFGGADSSLLSDKTFTADSASLAKEFWAPTAGERRKKLFPFIWTTIAAQGQLYGNRLLANKMDVRNGYRISYPGYNEMFTGYPDTLIATNDKIPNKNTTVLAYLNAQPALNGKVAAFASWDVFNFIFNEAQSGFTVNAGIDKMELNTPRANLLNEMQATCFRPFEEGIRPDLLTYYLAKEYLLVKKPRVLYIGFDDTDDWAHNGRYDYYLQSAHLTDGYIADLWQTLQAMPQYKNKTTLLLTTDHGRGDAIKKEWTSHGKNIAGAQQTWVALLGKGIKPGGEIATAGQGYQAQIAQTVAMLLGYTFSANHPVEKALDAVLKK